MSRLWLMLINKRFLGRLHFITPTDPNTPSSSRMSTLESHPAAKPSFTENPGAKDQVWQHAPGALSAIIPTITTDSWNAWDHPASIQIINSTSSNANETTTSTTTADGTTKTGDGTDIWASTITDSSQVLAPTTSTPSPSSTMTTTTTTVTASAATNMLHAAPTEDGSYSGIGSTQTKLAIALPIAIVGLLMIIGLLWFYLRRRRQQRYAQPIFDMATSQKTAVSTSDLMGFHKIATPEASASSRPHVPVLNVPGEQSREESYAPSPGSASARSPDDSNTELGLAVAVSMNQRMSATEHDLCGLGRSASTVAAGIRLPFQSNHGGDDDDAISVVSDLNERRDREHDFDDLSSVSSFNDHHPGPDRHGRRRGETI